MGGVFLIDVGNSRLKWARSSGNDLIDQGDVEYGPEGTKKLLDAQWSQLSKPERVLVASVAGERLNEKLRDWVKSRWKRSPEFVVPSRSDQGVSNAYTKPERLGADRWATLVAAHHRHRGPSCIVDCGTAVTVDAMAANGEHLGGLILPGLTMMRLALAENTQGIGQVVSGNVSLLARNTEDGVTAGTLYTLVAAIDRIVSDVAAALGGEVALILTGGDAGTLLPLLHERWRHEPDLVLQGLAIIAEGA